MKQIQMASIFKDSNGTRIGTVHSVIEGNKLVKNNCRQSYVLTGEEEKALADAILALGQILIDGDDDA